MRRVTALFLALATAPLVGACGGAQTESEWTPGPPIPGLQLSGRWYSQDFGDMSLAQQGQAVTGKYEHPRGPEHDGTIRGAINGDLLKIEWIQPGKPQSGVFPVRGRAVFRIIEKGRKLDGRWGFDDDEVSAGAWKAEKSTFTE